MCYIIDQGFHIIAMGLIRTRGWALVKIMFQNYFRICQSYVVLQTIFQQQLILHPLLFHCETSGQGESY